MAMNHEIFPAVAKTACPIRSSLPACTRFTAGQMDIRRRSGSKKRVRSFVITGSTPLALQRTGGSKRWEATAPNPFDFQTDRSLLIELLSGCLPLIDAARATCALLAQYASYADVIAAPLWELEAVASLGERGARLLKSVHAAAIGLAAVSLKKATRIGDWTSLRTYLNTTMARERNEVFRVMFLNARNHLIADHVVAEGTPCFVNVSVRAVVQRSLQLGATAILVIHNHPSGDCSPSEDDVQVTRDLEAALKLLDIRLHDHVIVGKGQFYSFREARLVLA